MKLTRDEEDTQLRQSYEKEGQERSKARHIEDRKDTELLRQAILDLLNLSDHHLPNSPPLSDTTEPMTPKTLVQAQGKKRALSPGLPTPMAMSSFECRRRENMAKNQALLNDIAPLPKTPVKLQRPRRPSTASKEPVERREILKRSAKDQKEQSFTYDDHFAGPYTESESRSTTPPESLFVPPTEPIQRRITTKDVKTNDQVIVFPDNSNEFYTMRCARCYLTFDSAHGMLRHLQASDHRHLLEGDKTAAKAVDVCGVKIVDATMEWAKSRKVKFRGQYRSGSSTPRKEKGVQKVQLHNGMKAEVRGKSVVVAKKGHGLVGPAIKGTVLKKKIAVKGENTEGPIRQQREKTVWNFQEAEIIEID